MKKKWSAVVALVLTAAMLCGLLTSCGGSKKIEAGDYSGSVRFSHSAEIPVPALGTTDLTYETVDEWGADVIITVDEDGVIWNVQCSEPEGGRLFPNFMVWTVYGGKFTGSMTGVYSCEDIMAIQVDTEEDGFPVLNGDCSGIHLQDKEMTLLYDNEVACALIILAMQNAITANGLA